MKRVFVFIWIVILPFFAFKKDPKSVNTCEITLTWPFCHDTTTQDGIYYKCVLAKPCPCSSLSGLLNVKEIVITYMNNIVKADSGWSKAIQDLSLKVFKKDGSTEVLGPIMPFAIDSSSAIAGYKRYTVTLLFDDDQHAFTYDPQDKWIELSGSTGKTQLTNELKSVLVEVY